MVCTGAGDPRYDTLTINGTWTVTMQVNSSSDIRVTVTYGGVNWVFTDTCDQSPTAVRPAADVIDW